MKLLYKDLSMEFVSFEKQKNQIKLVFKHEKFSFSFSKHNQMWLFGFREAFSLIEVKDNPVFQWFVDCKDELTEKKEFSHFLFNESPLRVKLLAELGPNSYKKDFL